MKKLIFISVALVLLQFTGNAQKARLGFTAGAVTSNYSFKFDDVSFSGKSRTGITVGTLADIPLGKNCILQPAANFVQYGTTIENTSGDYTERDQVKVNSIEVPVNLLFNYPTNKGRFFIGAGPSLTFAVSGKGIHYNSIDGETEEALKFGSNADADMKQLNIGANFMAGYGFTNGLFLSFNYNAGLSNIEPGDSNEETSKSHYFGIRLGYLLK